MERFRKGTLGYASAREAESQFHKMETAYKAGRKTGASGLGKDANPYKDRPTTRSFCEREEWFRGWRSVRMDAIRAVRT